MPLPEPPVLSAGRKQSLLAQLPGVLNTGANLSSYREVLPMFARPTDCWLGMLAPNPPETMTASNSFYPLARVARTELPVGDKTGRLYDVFFLKNSRFIYDNLLVEGRGTRPSPWTALVCPAELPYVDCPVRETNEMPCDACEWWAHCATGKKVWAHLYYLKINAFHYLKCTKVDDLWRAPGQITGRISYRFHPQNPDVEKLTEASGELLAVPQFQHLFS